uniref:glycosyltransferase n=1 Tax=Rheinheimera sp. TaxID=1869214 RepID=UPI003AF864A1
MPGQKKAAFLTATLDFDVASVRYRAIYPALALERAGWLCELHPGPRTLRGRIEDFDVLIVVKLLDGGVVDVVAEAMDTDVPVVLDLCDDLLSRDYRSRLHSLHRLTMEAIGPDISRIVTTGPYLSRLLHARGIDPALMRIAPDCVETDADVVAAKTFAKTRAAPEATLTAAAISAAVGARRLQKNVLRAAGRAYGAVRHPLRAVKTLRAMADERRAGGRPESGMARAEESGEAALSLVGKSVIWFGNHGGPHSDFGVLTLLRIARELRAAHARAPFTLVVVSNDVEKFRLFIPAIGVPSIFVKWTHEMQARLLERASACVMPVGEDAFSQSKSSNRALLALQKGVPVVAQSLESLEPLKDCISIDDVEEGLVRALTDPQAVRADIERGRKIIEERFSLRAVGETWAAILEDAIAQAPKRHLLTRSSPEKLLVLIALLQDIDIAFPVIDEARKRGLEVAVIADLAPDRAKQACRAVGWDDARIAATRFTD